MKKHLFLILSLCSLKLLLGQTVNFQWARQFGDASVDYGYSVVSDGSGNVYTTGFFRGTVDFDPGAGVYNLISAGNADVFVSKLDAAGNFVWAKKIGGTLNDGGRGIDVDASGNVYTTGGFQGTTDFDPGVGVFTITAVGLGDIFVSKLDAAGNFVWAKSMGGATGGDGYSIYVDALGNVYTTGQFQGTVDFDPGIGVSNLSSAGGLDIFVSKLNTGGNFVWAKAIGASNSDFGYSIATDAAGNVYTTGYFIGTADFDPGIGVFNLISAGNSDVFVSKLNAAGNFVWAKAMGGTSNDIGRGIKVDASGNVYSTGQFQSTADFDPNPGSFNLFSSGLEDIFVSKLDASGNFVWAKQMGGPSGDFALSIDLDAAGNAYTTGYFIVGGDFDPGFATFNLTAAGGSDVFISKLDIAGSFVWAKSFGGTSSEECYSIATDASGNVYTTGFFNGTADFDPNAGIFNLTSLGLTEIFVHKISQGPLGVNEILTQNNSRIFPNPTNGQIYLSFENKTENISIKLFNATGQIIIEKTKLTLDKITLDISGQANGIYFLETSTDNNVTRTKLVKN